MCVVETAFYAYSDYSGLAQIYTDGELIVNQIVTDETHRSRPRPRGGHLAGLRDTRDPDFRLISDAMASAARVRSVLLPTVPIAFRTASMDRVMLVALAVLGEGEWV